MVSRVWTQLIQHRIAKMWIMARKFRVSFSKRVASLRMSFIRQKKRERPGRLELPLSLQRPLVMQWTAPIQRRRDVQNCGWY